jgi:uncharacterized protein
VTALSGAVSPELVFLLAGALVGGIVQGMSGFGFGMVAMSIWLWGLDARLALVLTVFGGLCGQVLSAVAVRQTVPLRRFLPFVIGGLVGVPLGIWLLPHLDDQALKRLVGALLAVGCPLMLFVPRALRVRTRADEGNDAFDGAAGFAGGVLGGLTGITAIAPALWSTARGYDKPMQRALLQNFNLVALTAVFAMLVWRGVVTAAMLPQLGIVAAAAIVPVMIGARVYHGLSDAAFRALVLAILTFAGVAILVAARG